MKEQILITQVNSLELTALIKDSVSDAISELKITQPQKVKDHFMSRTQVCEYLKVTPQTLIKWHKEDELVGSKIGTHFRYRKSNIDKFMKSKEV